MCIRDSVVVDDLCLGEPDFGIQHLFEIREFELALANFNDDFGRGHSPRLGGCGNVGDPDDQATALGQTKLGRLLLRRGLLGGFLGGGLLGGLFGSLLGRLFRLGFGACGRVTGA